MNHTTKPCRSNKRKYLVLLGGSKSSYPFLQAAQQKGLKTIVFDQNPDEYCADKSDVFYPISTFNTESIINILADYNQNSIAGIICYSSHREAQLTNLYLNNIYSEQKIPESVIEICYNKNAMRDALTSVDIPMPSIVYSNEQDYVSLQTFSRPCVLKKLSGIGSEGTIKFSDGKNASSYIDTNICKVKEIVIEEYVKGRQYHVDGYVYKGDIKILSLTEKYSRYYYRTPITTGFRNCINDSEITKVDLYKTLKDYSERALGRIGINNNFFGADIIIDDENNNYILEYGILLDSKIDRLLYHAGLDIYSLMVDISTSSKINPKDYSVLSKNVALRFMFADKSGIIVYGKTQDMIVEWECSNRSKVKRPNSIADTLGWIVCIEEDEQNVVWNQCQNINTNELYKVV